MCTTADKKTPKRHSEMHNEYHFVVNWSEEDQCYTGLCPDLFLGGVRGDNPEKVFNEIRDVAKWVLETYRENGKPLPTPAKNLEPV
jgi:predicted RNase H-like HicB family nuclease